MPTPGLRTGAWLPAHRRKLSAIRAPHKADPPDFYFDAESAQARLARAGEIPAKLTVESEKARQQHLASFEGVSWKTASGRCFTDEYWNPLVGLWVDRAGWDFVLDLVMPDPTNPYRNGLYDADSSTAWYAVRRYLHRAPAEDYARARKRAEPAFEALLTSRDWDKARGRDLLAFAFDRDTDWAARVLRGYLEGGADPGQLELLAAVCPDPELSLKAVERFGGLSYVYCCFDVVETLGSAALPLRATYRSRAAPDRKRVEQAAAVAQKLKALGQ